jgi:hypothetical protein
MSPVLSARKADVPHDANQSTPGNKNAVNSPPDLVEFFEEFLIGVDVPHLALVGVILLEVPIGGGR